MSKRHQASRRRIYGRRQHELHQRPDRLETDRDAVGVLAGASAGAPEAMLRFQGRRDGSVAFGFAD